MMEGATFYVLRKEIVKVKSLCLPKETWEIYRRQFTKEQFSEMQSLRRKNWEW